MYCFVLARGDFVGMLASLRKPEPTLGSQKPNRLEILACLVEKHSFDVVFLDLRTIAQESWRKLLLVLLVRLKAFQGRT